MTRLDAPPPSRPGEPDWDKEGAGWPNRAYSGFYRLGPHVWHLQDIPGPDADAPLALLIHGTGASTHSWAPLVRGLSASHRILALDLPGHAFTRSGGGFTPTLPAIGDAIVALLDALGLRPGLVAGHSAGAAIAVHVARALPAGTRVISLNGAMTPFPGVMRYVAPAAARAMTFGGLAAKMLSKSAGNGDRVRRLLRDTGSRPPEESIACYAALLRRPAHVAGTLEMMANWDLSEIKRDLAALDKPILFIAGGEDRAVDPGDAARLARLAPHGRSLTLPGLGHLAHEEDPGTILAAICDAVRDSPAGR